MIGNRNDRQRKTIGCESPHDIHAADIVWVHQMRGGGNTGDGLDWEDDQWRQLIEGRGHSIVAHDFYDDSEVLSLDEYNERLALFEGADLVMFSRDSNSGDYNDPTEHVTWTSDFTTPMIVMTPYLLRLSLGNGR